MKRCQKIILSALEHIKNAQQPDGSFISLSGTNENDFADAIPHSTTFFTSNILLCLEVATSHLETFLSPEAILMLNDIKKRAAEFLLEQKSDGWSFNYWSRNSREATALPYPDDLDDTFAAAAALVQYDASILDGTALANITQLLMATEIHEGGPYKTWLVGKNAPAEWHDVDIVVNSTVGYFLLLTNIKLPRLERFVDDAVQNDTILSRYYPTTFHTSYFASRYYKGRGGSQNAVARGTLANNIAIQLQNASKNITPLERAMALSSLINLGYGQKISPADTALLLSDAEQNGFAPHAFCIDPARGGQRSYAGASALTAGFVIEALSLVTDMDDCRASTASEMTVKRKTAFHERIRALARKACAETEVGADLRIAAIAQIEKNSDQKITFLANEFQSALQTKNKNVCASIVEQVSLANLYGWMAYTIYDDVVDGELENDPLLMPCANLFLRRLAGIYGKLNDGIPGMHHLFTNTMDRIDSANAWELNHCRLPTKTTTPFVLPSFDNYENLADRSIGHGMGPLALLLHIGCTTDSKEYQQVGWLFRHYLIARQLHDDAHDWADDLMRGRVNSVGALVLKRFQENYPNGMDGRLDIPTILPSLRKIFWEEVIDEASTLIRSHIDDARVVREKSNLLVNTRFLEDEMSRLESSAWKAVKERNDTVAFLKRYEQYGQRKY